MFFKKRNISNQLGFDMLVEQELREYEKLLAQILIGEVHRRVHDANAVGSYRVGDVSNVDRVERLVGRVSLDEYLIVEVVQVAGDEHVNVAHNLKNVQALFNNRKNKAKAKNFRIM